MEEEKLFEPFFDLDRVSGIAEYVKFWLAAYSHDPREKSTVYDKLRVVFSNDSAYQVKILDGNKFCAVFLQRLGKKRLQNLKKCLEDMDKDRFCSIDWEYSIKYAKNKKNERRMINAA